MCFIRYPQIPMETMAAILGSKPPSYATGVVTRSFSASIPKWHSWSSKIQCPQLTFPSAPPPPPSVIVDVKSTPFQLFTSCMVHDHAITCSFLFFFLTLGWLTVLQAVGGNSRDSGCFTCKLDKQTWRRKKQ